VKIVFTFRGWIKHWFDYFPSYHIFDWFQFVDEFLDAFESMITINYVKNFRLC
jgi:hypothetical protein